MRATEWLEEMGERVELSEGKDRLSEYLDLAEKEEVIITRHGTCP
jgi:prevent-host-death family protein